MRKNIEQKIQLNDFRYLNIAKRHGDDNDMNDIETVEISTLTGFQVTACSTNKPPNIKPMLFYCWINIKQSLVQHLEFERKYVKNVLLTGTPEDRVMQ